MINRFFNETVGITYDSIKATIISRWTGGDEPPFKKLEHSLHKVWLTSRFSLLRELRMIVANNTAR